ncbi:hypothetical protein HY628_01200 [Candidatus Uhrbacteria bacterium]|nr:hypothetical protein [Candidatus Uhrbacteria bacterium]
MPFLGTHVANIALNKQIGLVFLLARPQETHGLTDVSHESFLNDQLQVARWMILRFMEHYDYEQMPKPWIEVPEWRVKVMEMPDPTESASFEKSLGQILGEAQALKDQLWNPKNEEARSFLLRLASQINECVRYTNRRLEAIKLCSRLGDMDENADPLEFEEELLTVGPKLAREIIENCSMGIGMRAIAAIGYLGIKNSVPALRVFAQNILKLVGELVADEAVRRGYTSPTSDERSSSPSQS